MNTQGIFEVGTQQDRDQLTRDLARTVKEYYFQDNTFNSLSEIRAYAVKHKIKSGEITHDVNRWGDVASLLELSKKEATARYK